MDMFWTILVDAFYLLIIINPVSKLAILCTPAPDNRTSDLSKAAVSSTYVAAGILVLSILCGNLILNHIFRLHISSLQIAGGLVLAFVGFNALRKGIFFELDISARFSDLAIVPLACPLIAGPATITAVIQMSSTARPLPLFCAVAAALLANLVLMICAAPIGKVLMRFNAIGALIRLTGLIIMTMGVEMMTEGILKRFAHLS